MATPAEIIKTVASLQNDTAQDVYTNEACLPYLNLALHTLQEEFEQNDIAVSFETSAVIPVNAGITAIGLATTPALPANLIEIKQLWESPRNMNRFLPMGRRDFLSHHAESDARISQLLVWAWINQEIRLIPAIADNDLKLDYLKSLFPMVTIATINTPITIINSQTYLEFETASLCSLFIGENETRAIALNNKAISALDRALGINVKGRQAIRTRRRPFRASFKSRSRI